MCLQSNYLLLLFLSTLVPQISCHPILIVISFDGFGNDYVNHSLTPNLYRLGQNGVRGHMRSSFVTKTYQNHMTIATGYYEEDHGIVNGPQLPIWIANQMGSNGEPRLSGSMQWPGSHVHYRNQTIRYLQTYEENNPMPWNERIDKMIEWMTNRPENANCVFAYFDNPDTEAHKCVLRADQTIGYLLLKLEEKSLLSRTNLIVLSDHGMAEINESRVISLNTFLNKSWYSIYGASPVWSILPKAGYEERVYQTLFDNSKTMNFTVYKNEDIPQEFHYNKHRRILPLFIMADEGWDIYQHFNKSWLNGTNVWGNHGYNNSFASMRPLFIASGPAFKSGYEHNKPFPNVDLYPLMLNVLQLFPTKRYPSNGSLSHIYDLLIPTLYSGDYNSSEQKWSEFIPYIIGGFGILFFGCVGLIYWLRKRNNSRVTETPSFYMDILQDSDEDTIL